MTTVNPIKLETGLRPNRAGIPYTLLLRMETIGFPTFGLLLQGLSGLGGYGGFRFTAKGFKHQDLCLRMQRFVCVGPHGESRYKVLVESLLQEGRLLGNL